MSSTYIEDGTVGVGNKFVDNMMVDEDPFAVAFRMTREFRLGDLVPWSTGVPVAYAGPRDPN